MNAVIRRLGLSEYLPTLHAMQDYTATRDAASSDEIWLLQHPPVYTVGQAGKEEHLPRAASDIPVVRIDRGGQITYHGPGQIIVYLLLDLRRQGIKVRELVNLMEQAVIDCLAGYAIVGERLAGAPGVYVGGAKVAALGLRVRNGCCYHGVSLNVDLDLAPFDLINPCGYAGLPVTRLHDLGVAEDVDAVGERLLRHLQALIDRPTGVG